MILSEMAQRSCQKRSPPTAIGVPRSTRCDLKEGSFGEERLAGDGPDEMMAIAISLAVTPFTL